MKRPGQRIREALGNASLHIEEILTLATHTGTIISKERLADNPKDDGGVYRITIQAKRKVVEAAVILYPPASTQPQVGQRAKLVIWKRTQSPYADLSQGHLEHPDD